MYLNSLYYDRTGALGTHIKMCMSNPDSFSPVPPIPPNSVYSPLYPFPSNPILDFPSILPTYDRHLSKTEASEEKKRTSRGGNSGLFNTVNGRMGWLKYKKHP